MTYFSPQLALSRRKRSWLQSKLSTLTALDGTRPAAVADFEAWRFAIPALGPELIVDGTFDDGADWSTAVGWEVTGGKAVFTGVTNAAIYQWFTTPVVGGKIYAVSFDVVRTAGNIYAAMLDGGTNVIGPTISASGSYTHYLTAATGNLRLYFGMTSTFAGSIDNVSVREVMLGDFGPELVTNGGFDTDSVWVKGSGWTISGGKANKTAGAGSPIEAPVSVTPENLYKLEYTISNYSAGAVQPDLLGVTAPSKAANGTYVEYITCGSTVRNLWIYANSSFVGSIDNVSLREAPKTPTLRECTFDEWFAYTSSTPAAETYTDASGVLRRQPYGRNLINFSQDFDSGGWTKSNLTVTASAIAAPDGTLTAEKLVEDSTTNVRLVSRTPASVTWLDNETYTASVYAKAGERNFFWIESRTKVPGFPQGFFNLSTGTVVSALNGATAAIEDAGNGWYRCSITASALTGSTGPNILFGPCISPPSRSYLGDGSSSLYVWGAQLESGSLSPYKPTTSNGEGVDTPRVDYSSGSRRLLLENASTNHLTYSQDISGASWSLLAATGMSPVGSGSALDQTIAPDGTMTADFARESSTHPIHYFYNGIFNNAATKTFSVFLKAGSRTKARIQIGASATSNGVYVDVDLVAGTIGIATLIGAVAYTPVGQSIQDFGGGWYRCSVTAVVPATTHVGYIVLLDAAGNRTYTGDDVSGLYVWGTQLEEASFASSYIPTQGSTVTRAINTARFSPMLEAVMQRSAASVLVRATQSGPSTGRIVGIDGTNSLLSLSSTSDMLAYNGTNFLFKTVGAGWPYSPFGAIMGFYSSGRAITGNGLTPATDTNAAGTRNTIYLARSATVGTSYGQGTYKLVAIYPTRLSNASLTALATP